MTNEMSWKSRVEQFFFAEEVPYGLALVRMSLPIVMLFMIVPRWFVTREIFSADGSPSQLSVGYGYGSMFPEFSGTVAVALNSLLVLASVTAAIGWCTRPSMIITFVLFTYFCWLDAISTTTKYTVIATHVFLILSVSHCGAVWSVDAWLANRRRQSWPGMAAVARPTFPVWPRRLLQLLIGAIYFGAALTKIQTSGFFSSDQLQAWMLTHINFRHPVGEYFALYPAILVVFAYVVVVWELLFSFIIWQRTFWRPVMLAIGVSFHFMTSLTLGLLIFPATCYCTYLAFVDEQDVQHAFAAMRKFCRKTSWLKFAVPQIASGISASAPALVRRTAPLAFAALAVGWMGAGVAWEHHLDPYGIRRPEGRHQLVAIDPEIAQAMLAPTTPLRDIDKFFAIDTGTFQFGDLLVDRRSSYRHGEKMIAQCHLNVPHEDMWIEMQLLDSENHLVARKNQVAARELYRAHFEYDITEATEPGDYTLVIRTAGNEVLRKPVTIFPRSRSMFGN